ncbi:MAG: poly-beta-1,6-N-acetyl-D-glucosamine biosynthesis protein PgaD [Thiomargarita sp.]|nr:poly-beta-1,6-N-acetyl-D-glucosamine biosynthesis protein PgaD [Thiomargarita sp.]
MKLPIMNKFIIDVPHLQTPLQRYGFRLLAFSGWMIWFYFFIPIIYSYGQTNGLEEAQALIGVEQKLFLIGYPAIFLGIIFVVISWSRYRIFLFRGKEKRRKPLIISNEEVANYFDVPLDKLSQWQQEKRLRVHIGNDDKGRIEKVDVL